MVTPGSREAAAAFAMVVQQRRRATQSVGTDVTGMPLTLRTESQPQQPPRSEWRDWFDLETLLKAEKLARIAGAVIELGKAIGSALRERVRRAVRPSAPTFAELSALARATIAAGDTQRTRDVLERLDREELTTRQATTLLSHQWLN